jgi:hypothetical protein
MDQDQQLLQNQLRQRNREKKLFQELHTEFDLLREGKSLNEEYQIDTERMKIDAAREL